MTLPAPQRHWMSLFRRTKQLTGFGVYRPIDIPLYTEDKNDIKDFASIKNIDYDTLHIPKLDAILKLWLSQHRIAVIRADGELVSLVENDPLKDIYADRAKRMTYTNFTALLDPTVINIVDNLMKNSNEYNTFNQLSTLLSNILAESDLTFLTKFISGWYHGVATLTKPALRHKIPLVHQQYPMLWLIARMNYLLNTRVR